MELRDKTVLVLGLGETGLSMARWLSGRGARVRVADSRVAPPNAERLAREVPDAKLYAGGFASRCFDGIDLIAISPGVALTEPSVERARARGVPVVGDVELFAQVRPKSASVLAITGSNGKSTVTRMTSEMCRSAGVTTVEAGNIGLPVLDTLAGSPPSVYVLELSSFQLETTESRGGTAATVLNVSEDHLDRYTGMAQYAAAKARVFEGCALQVLNRDDPWSRSMRRPGCRAVSFGLDVPPEEQDWGIREQGGEMHLAYGPRTLMPVAALGVPGLHNAANALAALALCRALDCPERPLLEALRRFRGLPHRMEPIARIDGVDYFNDSKGTNVGATVAALEGLRRRCVLIAGGDGKGQRFDPLGPPVAAYARAVVLIGRDRERLAEALAASGVELLRADSLDAAVACARSLAQPGDAVLLSPACASYDMFRDYKHRGEEFSRIVRTLERPR